MPTVFEKIANTLEQNTIDLQVSVQVGDLGAIQVSLRNFVDNVEAEFQSFIDDLSDVPVPTSVRAEDLETSFNALLDALPQDVSGLSIEITNETATIINHIDSAYIQPLATFFELYRCVDELIHSFPNLAITGPGVTTGPGGEAPAPTTDFMLSGALRDRLQALSDSFDELAAPLNGVAGLMVVAVVISYLPRRFFSADQLSQIDGIQLTVDTLVEWANNPNNIPTWLEDALQRVDDFVNDCFSASDLTDLISDAEQACIDFNNLYTANNPQADLSNIIAALDQLAIGINSDPTSLSDIDAALAVLTPGKAQTLKDKLQAISTGFFDGTTDENFTNGIDELLAKLEEKLLHILNQFSPAFETDLSSQWPALFPPQDINLELDHIADGVHNALQGLCNLINRLNLETISQDLVDDANNFQSDVQNWRDTLEGFFGQIDTQLLGFNNDVSAIQTEMGEVFNELQTEIDNHTESITSEVEQFLSLINTRIEGFIQLAENSAGSYTYEDLEASLDSFMQTVSESLQEFEADLERLQKNLKKVIADIETVSFKAVSDLVVDLIDDASTKLAGIDKDKVNDGLLLALTAALAVIPTEEELQSKIGELKEKMDELIEEGPVALLERIKDKPAEILADLQKKSPVPLIKERLSVIYGEIVTTLDRFQPTTLLEILPAKLAELQHLIDTANNPCHHLDAIIELHEDVLVAYDRLQPDRIKAFLETQQQQVAEVLDAAIPDALLQDIVNRLQAIADAPQDAIDLLDKVCAIIDSFTLNPENQIDNWLADINNAIDGLPNITALDNLIQGIRFKVDLFRNIELDLKVKTNLFTSLGLLQVLSDPLDSSLGLIPEYLHAYNGVFSIHADRINALPEPQRSKTLLVLQNFNPFVPEIEHNLSALEVLLERIRGFDEKLEEILNVWLSPNSPIYECLPLGANIEQVLKDCVAAEFKQPLLQLIDWLSPLSDLLSQVKTELNTFLSCLPDISGMAQALQDITAALENLQDMVANTTITPVSTIITNYEQVRNLLTALVPADPTQGLPGLRDAVCQSFEQFKASLQVSELLQQEDLEALEAVYQNLVDIAAQFDPVQWAEDSLEEEYNRLVAPLLDDFDLTQIFYLMLEKLSQLQEELKEELDRILKEFMEMLAAVPRLESPAELEINF